MITLEDQLDAIQPTQVVGRVVRTVGLAISVEGFPAPMGAVAAIERAGHEPLMAEVVGFQEQLTVLSPMGNLSGVRRGDRVRMVRTTPWIRVGPQLLGRVINAHGRCIDGRPQPVMADRTSIYREAPEAISRPPITGTISTGVRAIDGMLTCGLGQRMGIFAGPGVGKSTTLGMMARYTSADVKVIALIGERGREVNEFLLNDLGPEGLAKSVVIVATSDEPAVMRVRAAAVATAVAEYFRDQKKDVLLLMDSLTRLALAQREIGLAAGEPPTTRGFPPSVFSLLPRLLERTGRVAHGSITAFYSVLVEADDATEPISDAVRGLLDGHTWLSRKIAERGHYPAIDVLESISRLMSHIVGPDHLAAARNLRQLMGAYRDHEDLISIGAYRRGSNPLVDQAIEMQDTIQLYLQQAISEASSVDVARDQLMQLIRVSEQRRANQAAQATAATQPLSPPPEQRA